MSEQRKFPASSSLNSTRQLLDELDALMQRMMDLPVSDAPAEATSRPARAASLLEEAPDPETLGRLPAPPLREEKLHTPADRHEKPPTYMYEQTAAEEDEDEDETGAGPNAENESEEPEHDEETAPEESAAPRGETVVTRRPGELFPAPPVRLSPVSAETLAALQNIAPTPADPALVERSRLLAATAPRRRWWLWPLAAVNGVFDVFTYLLGPLGAWLRQPGGRLFLGWMGVALLLAAAGLQIALWCGWK
jgi:hypothetical protein